jgi:hypothetical protein
MDKEEITADAQRLGSYETSILPDQDCCTLFTPQFPSTRASLAAVEAAESRLDVEVLIASAVEATANAAATSGTSLTLVTVSVNVLDAVSPLSSVAITVISYSPTSSLSGVPVSSPVSGSIDSHAGRPVAL